ncbi:unnamed protein product [Allacma fusca]|uniref:Uncharacterized protein n=1 Tax=Allacma fusca TaxID=39272 RepID=A0A8J2NH84_9HEXA|nr:unnamed protein product [Allacma fusca]
MDFTHPGSMKELSFIVARTAEIAEGVILDWNLVLKDAGIIKMKIIEMERERLLLPMDNSVVEIRLKKFDYIEGHVKLAICFH